MSYRFLPWVRRGLAAEVTDPDGLEVDLPSRARLPVRITLAHGPQVPLELELYGPGDVTGLDTRAIVRTEPRPDTTNFPPDQFATIEFDPPDLPWLLTPARAGTNDQLRPWLALVVVARGPEVEIDTAPNRPLPRLTVEPASTATELPDLGESWAWAHAHMVEAGGGGDVPAALAAQPDLNVSRLLCPRRLEPDRDYIACLVPTTDAGRRAGLGLGAGEGTTTGPAWTGGARAVLPLYYHWSFRTGPAGDFESLARRLVPRPVADTVGRRPMFVGAADPALPALAPDAGGILELEGALRAPQADNSPEVAPEPTLVEALVRLLDAPDAHLAEGAPPEAEPVAPPIYGRWPVRRHTVPETQPRWLRELNVDPRHRAAAGLGADVVRENQERYVDAAWKQVGDVLAANRLRDLARLILRVGERIHTRHIATLGVDALFSLAAPVHNRIPVGDAVLGRRLQASMLPSGTEDPGFRRMAAPQGQVLRRAARLAGAPVTSPTVIDTLARGELQLNLATAALDGLITSQLLEMLPPASGGEISGAPLGLPGRAPVVMVEALSGALLQLEQQPPGSIILRPNIGLSGVVTEHQVEQVRAAVGVAGSLHGTLRLVVEHALQPASEVPPPVLGVEPPESLPASAAALAQAFEAQFQELDVVSLRPPPAAIELAQLHAGVVAALDPGPVIALRARERLQVNGVPLDERGSDDALRPTSDLGPVMAGPRLPEALYRDLAALDQDRLLPGAGQIPAETVTLLETNPRFVEAFLVGANHEMNRELLWRRYPTDRRGTPFRRFWERLDGQEDIGPIHEFLSAANLGNNSTGQLEGSLVLLVRGELLRRYPNSVVYAVPAGADGRLQPDAPLALPVFAGRLEPDLTFVGFDLTEEQVTPPPGWFFVIQEQPTEPRFGLDVPENGNGAVPPHWGELDWAHVGVAPGGHLRLSDTTLAGVSLPLADPSGPVANVGSATFGQNAAHMAAITFQRPFRAAIHSSDVLEAVSGSEGPA